MPPVAVHLEVVSARLSNHAIYFVEQEKSKASHTSELSLETLPTVHSPARPGLSPRSPAKTPATARAATPRPGPFWQGKDGETFESSQTQPGCGRRSCRGTNGLKRPVPCSFFGGTRHGSALKQRAVTPTNHRNTPSLELAVIGAVFVMDSPSCTEGITIESAGGNSFRTVKPLRPMSFPGSSFWEKDYTQSNRFSQSNTPNHPFEAADFSF